MAICKRCWENFSPERAALGYNTCLNCGDKEAQKEAKRNAKSFAPAYNKGPYMYIGSKALAISAGKK